MAHRQAVRLVVGNAFSASAKRTAFYAIGQPFEQSIRTHFSKAKSKSVYDYGAHRSDAEELIAQVPIVEVDGPVALCDGGGGALGHPLEYIMLANAQGEPVTCPYCGIRYKMKDSH